MAQKNLYYTLTEKMFNTFTSVGFRSVTFGSNNDTDIQKRIADYPFAHTSLASLAHSEKTTLFSFTIIVGDKVDKTPTLNYAKDNTVDIQQDLSNKMAQFIVDIQETGLNSYDDLVTGYDVILPVNAIAYRDDFSQIHTGFVYVVDFEVPNLADLCS
jgi:hypothetical protein